MKSVGVDEVLPSVWEIAEASLAASGEKPNFLRTAYRAGQLLLRQLPTPERVVDQPATPTTDTSLIDGALPIPEVLSDMGQLSDGSLIAPELPTPGIISDTEE